MSMPLYESLRWWPVAEKLPEDERTVLALARWPNGDVDWISAWRAEGQWRLATSAGLCGGVVLGWAEPQGPEEWL